MTPNSTNKSSRNPPADAKSTFGKTVDRIWTNCGESPNWSMNPLAAPPSTSPKKPRPIPQARAEPRLSPVARATGPERPSSERGMEGVGRVLVTPMSRRAKASTPTASRITVATATSATDGQSYWAPSATWLDVQPHQVRLANGASSGTGAW